MKPRSSCALCGFVFAGLALSGLLTSCFGSNSSPYLPQGRYVDGQVFKGMASWYGPGFNGRRTASGERFRQNELTAAHKTLPFGTIVRVTNLQNARTVDVRINDRGPFVRGRIIDLSKGAAQRLRMINTGVVPVEVRVLRLGAG